MDRLVRILLADANTTFLDSAAHFLALHGNVRLVGRAGTAADTLSQAAQLQPDLVLVDIGLRDLNGLEVTRQIKARHHSPRVVVLALSADGEYETAARHAGADGFVDKMDFNAQVSRCLQAWYGSPAAPVVLAAGGGPAA